MKTFVTTLVVTLSLAGWTLCAIAKFLANQWSYRARRLLPTLKADALLRAKYWRSLEVVGATVFILGVLLLAWAQNYF